MKKDDAETFWKNLEEKLGTPVLGRTLGRVLQEPSKKTRPLWGLFYTTAYSLWFQTFPSENWLAKMFRSRIEQPKPEDLILEIPAGDIEVFQASVPKGAFSRIFYSPSIVTVRWRPGGGDVLKEMRFETTDDAEKFVATLPRAAEPAGEESR